MTQTQAKQARLTIPNDLSYLSMALRFVRENALVMGFPEKAIKQIELCVEEAASNVIQHGFRPGEDAEFHIICEQTTLGLKTIIKDKGQPFDPTTAPDYDPKKPENAEQESGLGLFLIQKFMDEVTFHNLGRDGKELHLTKYLYQDKAKKPSSNKTTATEQNGTSETLPPKSIPFSVRLAKAADAVEISKCAYDAYEYTYLNEHIYYPERLVELIERGELISGLAVRKDAAKEVMAHNALIVRESEGKVAEMGMTFTKQAYRNQGCGKKLGMLLIKEAIKRGILGIFGEAHTGHVLSQRGVIGSGGRECAIFLIYAPDTMVTSGLSTGGKRLGGLLIYLRVPITGHLRLSRRKEIFIPRHHLVMVKNIYKYLKVDAKFGKPDTHDPMMPEESSILKVQVMGPLGVAKIEVQSFGQDIFSQVESTVRGLCLEKMDAIYLHLNLTDPLTATHSEKFESMGFFFSGIMPGPVSGDKLILQYLNNIEVDYDGFHLYTDFAKDLLAYIKQRDPIRKSMSSSGT